MMKRFRLWVEPNENFRTVRWIFIGANRNKLRSSCLLVRSPLEALLQVIYHFHDSFSGMESAKSFHGSILATRQGNDLYVTSRGCRYVLLVLFRQVIEKLVGLIRKEVHHDWWCLHQVKFFTSISAKVLDQSVKQAASLDIRYGQPSKQELGFTCFCGKELNLRHFALNSSPLGVSGMNLLACKPYRRLVASDFVLYFSMDDFVRGTFEACAGWWGFPRWNCRCILQEEEAEDQGNSQSWFSSWRKHFHHNNIIDLLDLLMNGIFCETCNCNRRNGIRIYSLSKLVCDINREDPCMQLVTKNVEQSTIRHMDGSLH